MKEETIQEMQRENDAAWELELRNCKLKPTTFWNIVGQMQNLLEVHPPLDQSKHPAIILREMAVLNATDLDSKQKLKLQIAQMIKEAGGQLPDWMLNANHANTWNKTDFVKVLVDEEQDGLLTKEQATGLNPTSVFKMNSAPKVPAVPSVFSPKPTDHSCEQMNKLVKELWDGLHFMAAINGHALKIENAIKRIHEPLLRQLSKAGIVPIDFPAEVVQAPESMPSPQPFEPEPQPEKEASAISVPTEECQFCNVNPAEGVTNHSNNICSLCARNFNAKWTPFKPTKERSEELQEKVSAALDNEIGSREIGLLQEKINTAIAEEEQFAAGRTVSAEDVEKMVWEKIQDILPIMEPQRADGCYLVDLHMLSSSVYPNEGTWAWIETDKVTACDDAIYFSFCIKQWVQQPVTVSLTW